MGTTMPSNAFHTPPRWRGIRWHGIRFVFLVTMAAGFAFSPLTWAKKPKASASSTDASYVAALATANRFLTAWQNHDQEAGLPLVTNRAKQQSSAAEIDALFSDSAARAFEISRGHQLSRDRYLFPVLLLQTDTPARVRRKFTGILIVNTGKNDWEVDKLP